MKTPKQHLDELEGNDFDALESLVLSVQQDAVEACAKVPAATLESFLEFHSKDRDGKKQYIGVDFRQGAEDMADLTEQDIRALLPKEPS